MRNVKILSLTVLISLSATVCGCNLFPGNRTTRPAPIRPTPTKNMQSLKAISENDLLKRVSSIEQAVKKNSWSTANSNTNNLGVDMARLRPTKSDGKSLRDMTRFNLIYSKLQADVKTKNKSGCLRDTKNLRNALQDLKK